MVELNQQGEIKNQNEMFFTGLSTDEKPLKYNGITPPQFSMFYEIDTGKFFMFDKANELWCEQQ